MGDFTPNPGSRAKQGALNKLSSLFKRLVILNLNAAPAPVAINGAVMQIVGQDGVQTRLTWDTFANQGSLLFRRADGSAIASSALLSGDVIGAVQMTGYGATSYVTPGVRLQIQGTVAENWSDTAQGAYWSFVTTPLTTKNQAEMMRLQPSGGVSIGSSTFNATDPGAGNLAVQGSIAAESIAIPAGGTAGAGLKFSTTTNFGVFFGSGVPTLSAGKGSLYLRSDGSSSTTRMYVNTDGGTTWTAVNTVA